MARPCLFSHPKLHRLAYILEAPIPLCVGCLELLWHVANESGQDVIGDSINVELAAKWPGERGKLCQALLEVRLLDEIEPGKFAIHDFWHHCPDYVAKRYRNEAARKNRYAPRQRRPTAAWRENKGELDSLILPNSELGTPPAPAPAPINTPLPPTRGKKVASKDQAEQEALFARFYEMYPKKKQRAAAEKAWRKIKPDAALFQEITTALSWQKKSPEWLKDDGQFIPYPSTWINGRRWEDDRAAEQTATESHDVILAQQRERNQRLKAEQEALTRTGGTT